MAAIALATELVARLSERKQRVTTAESCTGGLLAAAITDVSGASLVFDQGVVSYANAAKTVLLDVPSATLNTYGAVSKKTAEAMAEGARRRAHADIAIAITGIAGPSGGTPEKPVGLVYVAINTAHATKSTEYRFIGDRSQIRAQAVAHALQDALAAVCAGA